MLRTLRNKMESTRSEDWRKNKYKIVFLTLTDSPETLVLPSDIENTSTSKNGRGTAFTQGQRYVSLARLAKGPKTRDYSFFAAYTLSSSKDGKDSHACKTKAQLLALWLLHAPLVLALDRCQSTKDRISKVSTDA